MFDDVELVYGVIAVAAALLLVVALANRWPLIIVIVLLNVVESQFGVDLNLRSGGTSISPDDVIFSIAATAAGVRLFTGAKLDRFQLLWLAVTLVLFAAFARGVSIHGFGLAAISYRRWFYFTAGALYVLSFPWDPRQFDRLAMAWLSLAALFTAAAMVMWLEPDLSPMSDELESWRILLAYESQRVIPAASTFILAEAALIGLAVWLRDRSMPFVSGGAVLFLAMVVLLYHRSVWAAMAAGLVVLMLLHPRGVIRLGAPLLLCGVLFGGLTLLGWGLGGDLVVSQIDSAITEVAAEDSTLSWRVEGWTVLVERNLPERGYRRAWTVDLVSDSCDLDSLPHLHRRRSGPAGPPDRDRADGRHHGLQHPVFARHRSVRLDGRDRLSGRDPRRKPDTAAGGVDAAGPAATKPDGLIPRSRQASRRQAWATPMPSNAAQVAAMAGICGLKSTRACPPSSMLAASPSAGKMPSRRRTSAPFAQIATSQPSAVTKATAAGMPSSAASSR
jgi:hypothetical protein